MNSRRKFIVQGAMAAGSFALLNPLKGLALSPSNNNAAAAKISIFNMGSFNSKAGLYEERNAALLNNLAKLKKQNSPSLLLNMGNHSTDSLFPATPTMENFYETDLMSLHKLKEFSNVAKSTLLPYDITTKGKIKVGVISNIESKIPAITDAYYLKKASSSINATAKYLKENENCDFIALMQNYQHTNDEIDTKIDIQLAELTQNVSMIASPLKPFKNSKTYVTRNVDKQEVIISFSGNDKTSMESIEVSYNSKKERIKIATKFVC